uniref:Uncharacterized protein n=1 Tax=Coccidioides posadasii RMSCC 3488 TaxID=454284 RepID=A0A0J6FPQ6_COCPO|nr:hypothetical protein CPAG_07747 [Coccidioides posadasii RMSCC 3488]
MVLLRSSSVDHPGFSFCFDFFHDPLHYVGELLWVLEQLNISLSCHQFEVVRIWMETLFAQGNSSQRKFMLGVLFRTPCQPVTESFLEAPDFVENLALLPDDDDDDDAAGTPVRRDT